VAELDDLLVYEHGTWPAFGDGVAEAADELRSAIGDRRWEDAIAAASRLAVVSERVLGMMRCRGVGEEMPPAEMFEALDALSGHPVLGLQLVDGRWAEFVDGYAFSQLAVGWWDPMDHLAMAMIGAEPPWPALSAELLVPGSYPDLREADGDFGRPWDRIEKEPWFDQVPEEGRSIERVSSDARFILAMTRGLYGTKLHELRALAHTVKFDEPRLFSALGELEAIGFAEVPATGRTLVTEAATLADLKAIATKAGLSTSGTKGRLVERLLDSGQTAALAKVANAARMYHPIAIGPGNRVLAPARAVAALWVAVWECEDLPEDDDTSGLDGGYDWGGGQPDPAERADPPGTVWRLDLGGVVREAIEVGDQLVVLTSGPTIHAIGADGVDIWATDIEAPGVGDLPSLVEHDGQIVVGLEDRVVAIETASGQLAWNWRSDATLTQPLVVAGDRVLVVTTDGLCAVEEGVLQWEFERKDLTVPVVDGGLVVVMRASTTANVLDLETGALQFRRVMHEAPRIWSPLVHDGLLLFGGDLGGGVVVGALDLRSGQLVWLTDAAGWPSFKAAEAPPDRVRAAIIARGRQPDVTYSARQALMFLERSIGLAEASLDDREARPGVLREQPHLSLLGELAGVTVVGADRTLWGIGAPQVDLTVEAPVGDLPSELVFAGTVEVPEGAMLHVPDLPPVVHRGDLAIVAGGFHVVGIDRPTATVVWSAEVVANGLHLAGSICIAVWDRYLVGLSAADGRELWNREVASEVLAIAHDVDGIMVALRDGRALPLDPSTGRSRWHGSEPLDPDASEPPWVRWRLLSLEGWSHATGEVAGEADYASLLGSGEGTGGPSGAPGPFGGTWSWRDPADRATARIWDRDGAQVGQGRRYR
jgi:outer membrane protein assembly factor BamB